MANNWCYAEQKSIRFNNKATIFYGISKAVRKSMSCCPDDPSWTTGRSVPPSLVSWIWNASERCRGTSFSEKIVNRDSQHGHQDRQQNNADNHAIQKTKLREEFALFHSEMHEAFETVHVRGPLLLGNELRPTTKSFLNFAQYRPSDGQEILKTFKNTEMHT